ncbi:MAG: hypothetical protein ACJ77F_00290 [Chloroflexota bacterium]
MDRRVAQGRSEPIESRLLHSDAVTAALGSRRWAIALSIAIGLGLMLTALLVYTSTQSFRIYDHFEWQAQAFLEGQTAIRYPVGTLDPCSGNACFNDVRPVPSSDGVPRGDMPFPPLPAVLLMPFVAMWGRATDGQLLFGILAAIDVGICWWVLGRLPIRRAIRLAVTVFFAFGTVFWYSAQLATTWYQAHIVALALLLLSVGIALGADPDAAIDEDDLQRDPEAERADTTATPRTARIAAAARSQVDGRQVLAGFLFGLACTSRLPIVFGAPFYVLVGSGGSWKRRGLSAAIGAAVPIGALLVYNLVSTGQLFHPGYQYLYELEAGFYTNLGYHLDWSIEDPRYIPQNLAIMLFNTPAILPDIYPAGLGNGQALCTAPGAVRGLFDAACPIALPRDTGMSLLLTSPAYLFAIPALTRYGRSRLVTGSVLAILVITFVNLMHFSQGWVQFGYRFSLDFAPWALILVALGMNRIRMSYGPAIAGVLIGVGLVLSIAVNYWGVRWGNVLGW